MSYTVYIRVVDNDNQKQEAEYKLSPMVDVKGRWIKNSSGETYFHPIEKPMVNKGGYYSKCLGDMAETAVIEAAKAMQEQMRNNNAND